MSHFLVYVVAPKGVEELSELENTASRLLLPFSENGEWFRDGSRWDWWVIGGRWSGRIQGEDRLEGKDWRYVYTDEAQDIRHNILRVGSLKRALRDGQRVPFAIIDSDGKWHERARMGWFGTDDGDGTEEYTWPEEALENRGRSRRFLLGRQRGLPRMSRSKRQEYWELYGGHGSAPERVHLGVTATRAGLTPAPIRTFGAELAGRNVAANRRLALHLGDCVGGDAQAWVVGLAFGCRVVGHPASYPVGQQAGLWYHEQRLPHPPLARNQYIVNESSVLLALPRRLHEEQRSGTWATVRYARRVGRECVILWPDGRRTNDS